MSEMISERTMAPPESGVTVRMYRLHGLGDCFLLAFRAKDGSGRYMLIDCGILTGTKGGSTRLKAIAEDIAAATDHHLHILVATHEHWDHVSGFQYAKDIFDTIQVDKVWLAWTEDPQNPLAKRLRAKHNNALRALNAAATQLKAAGDPNAASIEKVLSFHGGFNPVLGTAGTARLLDYVRNKSTDVHYCRPGMPRLFVPEVEGVHIYVLGPPEDETLLGRSDPSRTEGEVYQMTWALNARTAFGLAALAGENTSALSTDEQLLLARSRPFDTRQSISMADAAEHEFFHKHYGFSSESGAPTWRWINTDWLVASEGLALDLDSDTNNSSLTLAIELTASQKVLLFAADAQVGNWLSWHEVSWPSTTADKDVEVTGRDLIKRTVLYKVGHHGSHNATLREKGVELMQSPDLVAMIPVDEEQAQDKKWAMPFNPLLQRLTEKTQGRILRSDRDLPEKPEDVPQAKWAEFLSNIREDDDLWIEYTVSE